MLILLRQTGGGTLFSKQLARNKEEQQAYPGSVIVRVEDSRGCHRRTIECDNSSALARFLNPLYELHVEVVPFCHTSSICLMAQQIRK